MLMYQMSQSTHRSLYVYRFNSIKGRSHYALIRAYRRETARTNGTHWKQ